MKHTRPVTSAQRRASGKHSTLVRCTHCWYFSDTLPCPQCGLRFCQNCATGHVPCPAPEQLALDLSMRPVGWTPRRRIM
jgi:hypothetical protein